MNHFQLKFTRDGTKDFYLEPPRNKNWKKECERKTYKCLKTSTFSIHRMKKHWLQITFDLTLYLGDADMWCWGGDLALLRNIEILCYFFPIIAAVTSLTP